MHEFKLINFFFIINVYKIFKHLFYFLCIKFKKKNFFNYILL